MTEAMNDLSLRQEGHKINCPECGSELHIITEGTMQYNQCARCGYKKRVEIEKNATEQELALDPDQHRDFTMPPEEEPEKIATEEDIEDIEFLDDVDKK